MRLRLKKESGKGKREENKKLKNKKKREVYKVRDKRNQVR